MIDYQKLTLDFEKTRTTKVNETKYLGYQVTWFFEGFSKLVSKTTFESQLTLNLDFQLTRELINFLETKIDELRSFYQETSKALERYLSEVSDERNAQNIYLDFLTNFYKNFKNYLELGLIPSVYQYVLHGDDLVNSEKFARETLNLQTMKSMRLLLKRIKKATSEPEVYQLLINAYEDKIQELELALKKRQ